MKNECEERSPSSNVNLLKLRPPFVLPPFTLNVVEDLLNDKIRERLIFFRWRYRFSIFNRRGWAGTSRVLPVLALCAFDVVFPANRLCEHDSDSQGEGRLEQAGTGFLRLNMKYHRDPRVCKLATAIALLARLRPLLFPISAFPQCPYGL